MTRPPVVATLALASLLATAAAAQKRSYDVIMKDAGSTWGTLRASLESGDLAAAASNAERLGQVFKEVEDFWTPFRTKDAIEAARGARNASLAVAAAARTRDLQKARASASGIGAFCTSCHASHREQMPDKTYRIRP